jgi:predicted transcriptional regulator
MKALSKREIDKVFASHPKHGTKKHQTTTMANGAKPRIKPRFTKKQVAEALRKSGGFVSYTAERLGVTEVTVRRYLRRWPELKEVREEIKQGMVDMAEHSLLKQVKDGNTVATIFLLKCLGKERGYIDSPQQHQHIHAHAGAGTWADIIERQMRAGNINTMTGAIEAEIVDESPKKLHQE